jgi:hypothetical protein
MSFRNSFIITAVLAVASLLTTRAAQAQTPTAFTYQGQLSSTGTPLTGPADLRAQLFTAAAGGSPVGAAIDLPNTSVTNGLFTALLDFGNAFDEGQPRWLEISVRSPAGTGSFTTLSPRQPLTPAPLAQGMAGISITRGGAEALDQAQDSGPRNAANIDYYAPAWQSWTPSRNGRLSRVQVRGFPASPPSDALLTVRVYSGVGTSGPLLGTGTLLLPASNYQPREHSVAIPDVHVKAGLPYTLAFFGNIGLEAASVPIPGASGVLGQNARDYWFRTFVTPLALISANAAGMPWSGLTGQAVVSTGAIGTGWQMLFTNAANSTFRGGMRLADNGFFEVTNNANAFNPNFARLSSTGGWTAVSDARLKTDVTTAEGNLAAAMKLRPVNFRWKSDGSADFGLIAQEVRDVLPRLVTGDEAKDSLTLNYSQLSVVAIGAIQELKAENDALKARIVALENTVTQSAVTQSGMTRTQAAGLGAGVVLPLLVIAAFRRRKS